MKTSTVSKLSALLVILAIGILCPLQAQNPEAQFQQGLMKEEGEGSLQEAIDIYSEVAADEAAGRPLQAEALLHMGLCYEKLGRTEAQKTYRNLINNYPDQPETVKVAREKLALLSQTNVASSPGNKELKIRKVWEQEDLWGEISPDGNYISYVDWNTGDLALYEIATGKKRLLTNKGTWDESFQFAEYSRWSPDGKHLVYSWYGENDIYDLRIIGSDGSGLKIIYSDEEETYWCPFDWSPDGSEILVYVNFTDHEDQIALISVIDGSMRPIKSCKFWPTNMCFSSDGQYIVYDRPVDTKSSNRDIYLLKRDGSSEIQLIGHPSDDFVQGWTPDGKHLLFSSDRDRTMGFYTIGISEGMAIGTPTLVKSGVEPDESFGFSPEGSFYYGISKEWNDVYMAELDPQNDQKLNRTTKMTSRYEGINKQPDYSPDGKFLAYITYQNLSGSKTKSWGGDVLVIRNLETGNEQEIIPDIYLFGFPRWSPDGKSILMVYRNAGNETGVFLIDIPSGQAKIIIEANKDLVGFGRHEWSPDGDSFFQGRYDSEKGVSRIIRHEFDSGQEKVIHESPTRIWQVFLSPDGKRLAYIDKDKGYGMSVLPATGGAPKDLFRFNEDDNIMPGTAGSVAWSVDGRYLFFVLRDTSLDEAIWELCRIPAEGGEIEKLGFAGSRQIANLSVHPDGRRIAFSSISTPLSPAVWVMENFLPSD